ncbi:MAG: hypothetical protein H6981_15195 [Gammaproteobacteria bacterium]|nr:hypothetical protein [Gammaproteobacteria bacterium]MCP5138131.1 hypothetical protein [Gammaproteobacteria bacterium]
MLGTDDAKRKRAEDQLIGSLFLPEGGDYDDEDDFVDEAMDAIDEGTFDRALAAAKVAYELGSPIGAYAYARLMTRLAERKHEASLPGNIEADAARAAYFSAINAGLWSAAEGVTENAGQAWFGASIGERLAANQLYGFDLAGEIESMRAQGVAVTDADIASANRLLGDAGWVEGRKVPVVEVESRGIEGILFDFQGTLMYIDQW